MAHFFVSINKGQKNIIGQQIIKVTKNIHIFNKIYEAVTEGVFGERDVKVYVGKGHDKWNYLREELHDNISLMSELELKYIRFVLQTEERKYSGNYLGTLNYIWKVLPLIDQRSETENAHVMAMIQENLPKYFTCQMRKNVLNKNIPAVDNRRQGLTLYLPLAISIRDLYDKHKVPIGEGVATSTGVHVAIMWDEMSLHLKEIFKKADTLEQIREAAKKNPDLKNELKECIRNVQNLLCT
ncbi:hypothetical protein C1645_737633 [Glomus cerebriforme]|uniref:Uncharacterized protein n=1 Tax=Glomus cerebriforme TaxID=658196 RepID=A0A397T6K0_9GLOM|nr:hypothetical protein C1645_737633 [Glomus cerebriforme]